MVANFHMQLRGNSYPDTLAQESIAFVSESVGTIAVPDTTASSTAYSIPFGAIATAATFLYVLNQTGQDLMLKLNGSANLTRIATGGTCILSMPVAPGATPLTAASLTTTATQSGAGTILYKVLGA